MSEEGCKRIDYTWFSTCNSACKLDVLLENKTDTNEIVALAARLIDTLETDRFLLEICAALQALATFKNFIVFHYSEGFSAELIATNLDQMRLAAQMKPYTDGLYLLDPFYIANVVERRHGLLRLVDVAPEDFEASEFYLRFYAAVNVLDEIHYVVPLESSRAVHLFIEREPPSERFRDQDVARLRAVAPLISSAVKAHWRWREGALPREAPLAIKSAGGIEAVIRNISPGELTDREVEVISLSLRGHSSKLIAGALGISEGTVTNHKRNVYEKLGIHSQSQLFSLFLSTLTERR